MRLSTMPKERLRQLLRLRNEAISAASEIDDEIQAVFKSRRAVLVIDLAGFTELTITHGIISYLATIQRMVVAVTPAILENGGRVLKQDADNLFAVFDDPTRAVEAALDAQRSARAVNLVVQPYEQVRLCIGIGFGDLLIVDPDDAFGSEMNLACKLGEDLAEPGEILLTELAAESVAPSRLWELRHDPDRGGYPVHSVHLSSER